jgi:hypothetical protein
MSLRSASNTDMLGWFGDDERHVCDACQESACVSLHGALASFCLSCSAVTLDGRRLDVDRRIPV